MQHKLNLNHHHLDLHLLHWSSRSDRLPCRLFVVIYLVFPRSCNVYFSGIVICISLNPHLDLHLVHWSSRSDSFPCGLFVVIYLVFPTHLQGVFLVYCHMYLSDIVICISLNHHLYVHLVHCIGEAAVTAFLAGYRVVACNTPSISTSKLTFSIIL